MNSKSLRQISFLSISTIGSRVLGLVRDATFFSYFGTSLIGSAFIIAFTIPNLFRRLLGEGALSSAFLPRFSQNWEISKLQAFQLLNQTLTRLLVYFGGSTLVLAVMLLALHRFVPLAHKWDITLPLLALLLPYAVLICMAAIVTAALNAIGKFFLASLSPILLNLMMIGSLIAGSYFWEPESLGLAYALAIGVLLGGCLQLSIPVLQTLKSQWRPTLDTRSSDDFEAVKKLFFTATGGAAILQVNVLITRLIAYQHSDEAVSQLYLASRLTELPLGVFAVSIYTVLFPLLSKYAASGDDSSFSATCNRGISMTLGITLPAAIGLMLLSGPILSLLFEWGRFSAKDVQQTAPVLAIYALSIPFYALISFLTRVFHSQQEMKTPVRVSGLALVLNIIFSITLMQFFDVEGLATATVITSTCQLLALSVVLAKSGWLTDNAKLWWAVLRILVASIVMGTVVILTKELLPMPENAERVELMLRLMAYIFSGVLSYGILVFCFGLRRVFKKP